MDQNGPRGPVRRSSVQPNTSSYHHLPLVKESRGITVFCLPSAIRSPVLVVVVVAMSLLCLPCSAQPCPEECVCWNATGTQPLLTIDCSNGSLQSFVAFLSRHSNAVDNVTAVMYQSHNNGSDIEALDVPGQLPEIYLDLSFNGVSSLQALGLYDWTAAHMVKKLNLSHNRIEILDPSYFRLFKNLVILDLSSNLISTFTPGVFQHVPSLKHIRLHNNQIANVEQQQPGDIEFISNLVRLDISHNRLPSLPANAFSPFLMLSSLNLAHNRIVAIDQFAFRGLSQLQVLLLSHNNLSSLDYPVFQNTSLVTLWLDNMPQLSHLSHNVFQGLTHLQYLNLSHNSQLSFLHHDIASSLQSLKTLDLTGTTIQKLSSLTFRSNPHLHTIHLQDVPLSCQCTNAWLVEHIYKNNSFFHNASTLECMDPQSNQSVPITEATFPCSNVSIPDIYTTVSVAIGSSLTLQCKQSFPSEDDIIIWTTPRGYNYYYHHFHANASQHLLSSKDVQPHAPYHKHHTWHQSSSYYSELDSYDNRILVLSDGSLFIDYILRTDAGSYRCVVKNAHFNDSASITVQFSYKISGEIKILACIVGILCAVGLFTLNVIYVVISWLARRLINKRRREHIRQMLENLNSYKSTHITRVYENYTGQLTRVRNRYHAQRDRLHKNYTMQVDRVKRGCSHQVEKVRDNYTNRLTQLREYSSSQIVQIREMATNQIGRIRDYGSLQLDRLRETYKLQHLHMMKLLDTMNLDNCRSIVETECMRTESMMYDLDLLSQEDVRMESPFSMNDSEYNTANSSPMLSVGSQESVEIKHQAGDQYDTVGETTGKYLISSEGDTETEQVLKVTRGGSVADDEAANDDIQIEMNTVLRLPDNIQLNAKEVWTYGQGDDSTHRLYTNIHTSGDTGQADASESLLEKYGNGSTVRVVDEGRTVAGVALPSLVQPSEWDSDYADQEESPTKVWDSSPPVFHYDDYTTVHLYDADGEEDEEEEKKETDTMV